MKSCATCKHFKPRGKGQILGDCKAWKPEEWHQLCKNVPCCLSVVWCGVRPDQGAFCAFFEAKKGKK